MSIRLCSLSSGSRGNCIVVASDTTSIIVDAGICVSSISMGLSLLGLDNPKVLITHCHSDHTKSLPMLYKKFKPEVYCHADCHNQISKKAGGPLIPVSGDFFLGDITVSPFKVSHDVQCAGYSFYQKGRKISVVTDLGQVDLACIKALEGSDIVFIEANHDEEMLLNNPSYPALLKNRILSKKGHLSNTDCGHAIVKIAQGVKQVVLGHLSQENNYPELAYDTVRKILKDNGIHEGRDIRIDVAGFGKPSNIYEVI